MVILLVDDDAGWRTLLERWLTREGMRAVGLARGEWVMHAIDLHRPDVVILDVHLPGLDGLHLVDMVRRRWPTLPVIVMTAFGSPETVDRAQRYGASGYLDKPFRMTDLTAALERAVSPPSTERGGPTTPGGGSRPIA